MCCAISSAYAESGISEVLPVEECDGVVMPGLWISGAALHDLHQAYLMERAKREALERSIDLMAQVERVYEAAQIASDSGVSWAWWVSFGAVTFTSGIVTGIYLTK